MTTLDEVLKLIPTAIRIENFQKIANWGELIQEIENLPDWMQVSPAYTKKHKEAKNWCYLIQKESDLETLNDPNEYELFLGLLNTQDECETKKTLLASFIRHARQNIFSKIEDLSKLPQLDHLLGTEIRQYLVETRIERLTRNAKDIVEKSPEIWIVHARTILSLYDEIKDPLDTETLSVKQNLQFKYDTQMRLATLEIAISDIHNTVKKIEFILSKKPSSFFNKIKTYFLTNKKVILGAALAGILISLLLWLLWWAFLYFSQVPLSSQTSPQQQITALAPSLEATPIKATEISNRNSSQGSDAATPTPSPIIVPTETVTPTKQPQLFRVILNKSDVAIQGIKVFNSDQSSDEFAYILFPANLDDNVPNGKVKIIVSSDGGESAGRIQIKLKALINKKFVKDGKSKGLVTFMNLINGRDTEIPRLQSPNAKNPANPIQWGYIGKNGLDIPVNIWRPDDSENIPNDCQWIEIIGWINVTNLQPDSGE